MAIAGQLDAMGETRGQIADEMPSRNSIAAMGRRATAVLGRGGGWDDENLGRVVGVARAPCRVRSVITHRAVRDWIWRGGGAS